ncbi:MULTISPECIES: iron chelate uptake ABC transporter family permease subunit [Bacillaceae]|uniref:metal ABC transporter permease n=1 Tax=Bacillaceae TaxID=186817 RepID=UPI00070186C6|nr:MULTISPECIES: iron chelate uptake ABC transporter family permease subunit [Bacillaceae]KQL34655.1 manganese ABC transporter [Psychrobacillus sp. FJAT-21963]MDF2067408.1 iron chelate uptake ABC transporter family permease subunit [Bacillus sp. Cr_A10]
MITGNLLWVLAGAILLGIAAGLNGTFAFLQKQSLVGDAAAHAALPGIAIAYLILQQKDLPILMLGAAITSAIAVYTIQWIVSQSKLKADAAIGLVLSVFFGIGIVLITLVNQSGAGNQSGLNDFIFGKAATLAKSDLIWLSGSAMLIIFMCLLFFKEWKLMIFDPVFAKGIGLPVERLRILLTALTVLTIVTGIQAVGVILMAAMLIIPAAAARFWSSHLGIILVTSAFFGALSGALGTLISSLRTGLSTGPIIVLSASLLFLISYFFAPTRGLLSKSRKKKAFKQPTIAREAMENE